MPKTDIIKLKYELDSKFSIIIKIKIEIRIPIIFIENNNNVFE